MNYMKYYPVDVVNGPGTRCTLFVSGCEHKCYQCYNASSWSLKAGCKFDKKMEDRVISDLLDTRINRQGLSLTGGDPLHPKNLSAVLNLLKRVKTDCKNKNIWCWTGYVIEELTTEQRKLISFIDVLIDGPYIQSKKQSTQAWLGSSNQRLLNLSTFP